MHGATRLVGALLVATALCGCVGGPSYVGGPTEEQPHALLYTGEDVSVWKVDGWQTYDRTGALYLEPGARTLRLRVQNPVDYDGPGIFWIRAYQIRVEEGHSYLIFRGESDFPPWPVEFQETAR
ncbi:MAG: hypothetical protein KDD82_21810 [Planctomycetes bacterium]|nr:hypothetical protein [Planctomycetota bacterium]